MQVLMLTPDREIYNGGAKSVQAPGVDGLFEVLDNHAPMVTALGHGSVRILNQDGSKETFTIEKGYLEVLNNEVSILVQGVA
jgi:F-type H+-transporting ATPase subunit epsilon